MAVKRGREVYRGRRKRLNVMGGEMETSIVLGLIGSIVFLLFFKLDKATMDKVERELAERRAKKVGTAE